jgi:hypothetical protein
MKLGTVSCAADASLRDVVGIMAKHRAPAVAVTETRARGPLESYPISTSSP